MIEEQKEIKLYYELLLNSLKEPNRREEFIIHQNSFYKYDLIFYLKDIKKLLDYNINLDLDLTNNNLIKKVLWVILVDNNKFQFNKYKDIFYNSNLVYYHIEQLINNNLIEISELDSHIKKIQNNIPVYFETFDSWIYILNNYKIDIHETIIEKLINYCIYNNNNIKKLKNCLENMHNRGLLQKEIFYDFMFKFYGYDDETLKNTLCKNYNDFCLKYNINITQTAATEYIKDELYEIKRSHSKELKQIDNKIDFLNNKFIELADYMKSRTIFF